MLMRKRPLGELLYGRLNLFVRGFVERMGTQRSLTEAERTAYRLPFRSAAERAGVVAFPRLIPQRPGDPTYDLLRRIEETVAEWELPALVVWADADAGFSAEMARQAVALLRQADGPHFVPASHYLQEDAPAEIMQQIDGFLTRNP
jgi:haloalkane dehalogenase